MNLDYYAIAKNAKMIKIHFLYLDKYGSYIKIFTREYFSKFYSVFYTVTHSGFERKNCRGGESLQKEEEREHKDSGKKKKKKFATAQNDKYKKKEEETSVGEMIFRDN